MGLKEIHLQHIPSQKSRPKIRSRKYSITIKFGPIFESRLSRVFENYCGNSPTCQKFDTPKKVVRHFYIPMLLFPKTLSNIFEKKWSPNITRILFTRNYGSRRSIVGLSSATPSYPPQTIRMVGVGTMELLSLNPLSNSYSDGCKRNYFQIHSEQN